MLAVRRCHCRSIWQAIRFRRFYQPPFFGELHQAALRYRLPKSFMNSRAENITVVRTACACALGLTSLLAVGCGAPWMLEYEDQFTRYRVDNPDGDNLWDTGDLNGNGEMDHDEVVGPLVDFDHVHDSSPSNGSTISQGNSTLATPGTSTTVGSFQPLPVQPGFPDVVPTLILPADFGDLVFFSPFSSFAEQTDDRSKVQVRGMQVVRGLRFSNREEVKDTDQTEHSFELSSGMRYFRLQDRNYFDRFSGILGRFVVDTSMDNVSFGPQLGLRWGSSNRNWNFDAEGIFLLGYNRIDGRQTGRMGGDLGLVPGQLNRLVNAQSTSFSSNNDDENFSPIGEVRAATSYHLTQSVAVNLGYSAFYVGNQQYAEEAVNWELPSMGISTAPEQDWFTETLYANIELLR